MEASNPKHVVIVGAGITGLACALRLVEKSAGAVSVTLIDASPRLGGVIHTVKQDGYILEAGPENFVTNKPWALALCKRLGLEDQILPTNDAFRRALIVRGGKLAPIPEGFLLLAPTKIWPMVTTPLFSLPGKVRMAMEYFLPARKNSSADESLASFVTRRFGREALDRAVQPLIGGIYTADPEFLSLRATMPMFLDMEQKYGSIIRGMRKQAKERAHGSGPSSGARYSLFVTLRGGLCTLVDAIRQRLTGVTIRTGTRVTRIDAGERWKITLGDGTAIDADGVVLCGPSRAASNLLRSVDASLADQLGAVQYASSAVAHLAYRREDVPHPLDAFGFVVPTIEKRNLIAGSFSSVKFEGRAPQGMVLMRAFLGGATNPQIMQRDDAGMLAATRNDLRDLLGITVEPAMAMVHRWTDSMPQYAVGHLDRVADIRARVKSYPGLELGGNGFEGVGIPDCIHAGDDAADRIMNKLRVGAPSA